MVLHKVNHVIQSIRMDFLVGPWGPHTLCQHHWSHKCTAYRNALLGFIARKPLVLGPPCLRFSGLSYGPSGVLFFRPRVVNMLEWAGSENGRQMQNARQIKCKSRMVPPPPRHTRSPKMTMTFIDLGFQKQTFSYLCGLCILELRAWTHQISFLKISLWDWSGSLWLLLSRATLGPGVPWWWRAPIPHWFQPYINATVAMMSCYGDVPWCDSCQEDRVAPWCCGFPVRLVLMSRLDVCLSKEVRLSMVSTVSEWSVRRPALFISSLYRGSPCSSMVGMGAASSRHWSEAYPVIQWWVWRLTLVSNHRYWGFHGRFPFVSVFCMEGKLIGPETDYIWGGGVNVGPISRNRISRNVPLNQGLYRAFWRCLMFFL